MAEKEQKINSLTENFSNIKLNETDNSNKKESAIKIQACWRGYIVRKELKKLSDKKSKDKESIGSKTAKGGYRAEKHFRENKKVKESLEAFLKNKIKEIKKSKHGKKHDNIIVLEDESEIKIQNKKIVNENGRGNSFNRGKIDEINHDEIIKNLKKLSYSRPTKTTTSMENEEKKEFIELCNNNKDILKNYITNCLGENNYWCFMKSNDNFDNIELYIISHKELINYLLKNIKISIPLKKTGTCLRLSDNIYLQRKGGGKTDKNPDDLQSKLIIDKNLLSICKKIL
jgi:hypothetical protein